MNPTPAASSTACIVEPLCIGAMFDVVHGRCRDAGLRRKLRSGQPGHRAPGGSIVIMSAFYHR
jgi:hypothetical protein